ncbi:hypothetical protein DSO57_1038901 [Entomophthora muscae]|uniref:Uncharacterized protein n=2 Tax=Entomophthora muscae TaxID=34485 RepID=A0ACC2S0M0_9FUNG|nr:hypothetical protein DSO57_1022945 [Entomophthora muscae]KAJ9055864.1 hypothetical protein DSO57_1038901 [Entomophthora muscae]
MVKIKITSGSAISKFLVLGSEEMIIIELQGSIETDEGSSLIGETVGEITWDGGSSPSLLVGNHKLFGKLVDINPPLAFLQRAVTGKSALDSCDNESEYKVRAVITKKMKFTTRPIIVLDNE